MSKQSVVSVCFFEKAGIAAGYNNCKAELTPGALEVAELACLSYR